ncbi:hypothetical protein DFQ28_005474, partial [Apophysomyces sp. BC1034]
MSSRSSRTTSLSRISLPFLVWTNCPKKTSLLSSVPVRSSVSCPSPSLSPRSSLVMKVVLSSSRTPSALSRKSWTVSTTTCPNLLSTCRVISTMSSSVPKNSPRKWVPN